MLAPCISTSTASAGRERPGRPTTSSTPRTAPWCRRSPWLAPPTSTPPSAAAGGLRRVVGGDAAASGGPDQVGGLLDERADDLAGGAEAGGQADQARQRVRRPGHGRQHRLLRRRRPEPRGQGGRASTAATTPRSIRREPIGVVGSIAPWNYPLQMAAWKILPAVAAGNTIVLKPAEITPLTSLMFAEAAADAGIPAGVVNVVTGRGPVVGEALIEPPGRRHGVVHRLHPGRDAA